MPQKPAYKFTKHFLGIGQKSVNDWLFYFISYIFNKNNGLQKYSFFVLYLKLIENTIDFHQ